MRKAPDTLAAAVKSLEAAERQLLKQRDKETRRVTQIHLDNLIGAVSHNRAAAARLQGAQPKEESTDDPG